MNISFRLLTEAELDVADHMLVAAYQFSQSRKGVVCQYWTFQPDGWWLVLADGEPVGYGGAVDYGAFSSIGMLSVTPDMQRRGVGQALMEHIMAWCVARGCHTMLLEANEKSASLYRRLGFVEEDLTLDFSQEEQTMPQDFSADGSISLLRPEDIPAIVSFDATYFGADRSRILVAGAKIAADRLFVARNKSSDVTGYVIAKSSYLGPWVASTSESAEKLLNRVLALPIAGARSLSIPRMNREGIHLLEQYGFRQKRSMFHMRYGSPVPRHRDRIFALTSPALG
jgi:GNAT superfamily N-acetyltransferase